MEEIQNALFKKAKDILDSRTFTMDDYEAFKTKCEEGGMFLLHWCGRRECEDQIKAETKTTIRCLSFEYKEEKGKCICCGKPSERRVHFARSH
jgi:prolyl-tRNA synthetase